MRTTLAALSVCALLAACSSSSPGTPAPEPFDPVGSYELNTSVQGTPVAMALEVTGEEGAWGGRVTIADLAPVTLNSVEFDRETRVMIVRGNMPDGALYLRLVVSEDGSIEGSWSAGDENGEVTGQRTSG